MNARRHSILLLSGLALLLAGCGDEDATSDERPAATAPVQTEIQPAETQPAETQPAETRPSRSAPDVAATDSGVEGVPIPDSAEATGEGQWSVPGMSYLELVAWYEEQMPEGADHDEWTWCDVGGSDGTSTDDVVHSHIYSGPASEIISVDISNDDPPRVLIVTDESGPC